jgi:outer membrane protein TolC
MRSRVAGWLTVICLAVARGARAEEFVLPTEAVLARLIEQSLDARPELAAAAAIVQAQEQRVPQAGALPDPMLQIGIQNDGFTSIQIGRMETSYVSFMASQTFPWPGERGLRTELAELGAAESRQVVARLRLSTEAEVRRAFLDLVLARDRLALLDELEVVWQNALGTARARYEAGAGAQSDVLRAQLEQTRINQRRILLQVAEQGGRQAINRLRAQPLDAPIETTRHAQTRSELAAFASRFSVERARAHSPELAAARLGTARTERSVALAEKSFYPDLTVAAGIMLRGALPPMWLATLAGPVPLFAGRKQSRAVSESRAWASAAQSEVTRIEQVLNLRTVERRTAFAAVLATIVLYEQGLLIQSQATTESTLSQYKAGKVTFASVLEANAGFISDQDGYLEAVAAAERILISEAEISLAPALAPAAGLGGPASAGSNGGM